MATNASSCSNPIHVHVRGARTIATSQIVSFGRIPPCACIELLARICVGPERVSLARRHHELAAQVRRAVAPRRTAASRLGYLQALRSTSLLTPPLARVLGHRGCSSPAAWRPFRQYPLLRPGPSDSAPRLYFQPYQPRSALAATRAGHRRGRAAAPPPSQPACPSARAARRAAPSGRRQSPARSRSRGMRALRGR